MSSSSPSPTMPEPHKHTKDQCPFLKASGADPHAFCPPQPGDYRAPCPALNTMANHGYLPRDGKNLTPDLIIKAMRECFNLSGTLAWFLTTGALSLLLGQSNRGGQKLCLHDLARHGGVEHDASLYHQDAGDEEYAPIHGDPQMLEQFFAGSADGRVMTPLDVARVRARREVTYAKGIDFIHAELARGEMGIVLNCFNNPNPTLHAQGVPLASPSFSLSGLVKRLLRIKPNPKSTPIDGVPVEVLRYWFEHERLPEGWKPYHKTTLRQTIGTVGVMRGGMRRFAKELKAKAAAGVPAAEEKAEEAHAHAVKLVIEPAINMSPASPVSSEPTSASDHTQTLVVPSDIVGSVRSATSSVFTDMPPTPKTGSFISSTGKDAAVQVQYQDVAIIGGIVKTQEISGLPQIVEHDSALSAL